MFGGEGVFELYLSSFGGPLLSILFLPVGELPFPRNDVVVVGVVDILLDFFFVDFGVDLLIETLPESEHFLMLLLFLDLFHPLIFLSLVLVDEGPLLHDRSPGHHRFRFRVLHG